MKRESAIRKMASVYLINAGLTQTVNEKKIKMQYLQSTIKWSMIKWGMPEKYCFYYFCLKSVSVISLVLFLCLKIALAIQGLLWFHTNFRIVFSICKKCHWNFDSYYTESIDGLWSYGHFNNINSSFSWTW